MLFCISNLISLCSGNYADCNVSEDSNSYEMVRTPLLARPLEDKQEVIKSTDQKICVLVFIKKK